MSKYFGWTDREDVADDFFSRRYRDPKPEIPSDFPTDDEILFADYHCYSYEGSAHVIYQRHGRLFQVEGSHCSCYGLEDQWSPGKTTWAALKLRKDKGTFYSLSPEGQEALFKMIEANS